MYHLDKSDLISLVKGISPPYSVFSHELVKNCGSYVGGFHDRWEWDNNCLDALSKDKLWELYKLCKDSDKAFKHEIYETTFEEQAENMNKLSYVIKEATMSSRKEMGKALINMLTKQ